MQDLEGFGFVLPHWLYWGWLAIMPLLLLWLLRHHTEPLPVASTHNRFTRILDWISEASGLWVAFWTINAVCAYFYEVIMRYVFNMPTIWVHEASYLLFGMQYLLAGAYTLLHGGHVRVDVIYDKLPRRGQVGLDIITAIFFFIFAGALLGTSWDFFYSSYNMNETSIETWQIQYWPIKFMMLLGAFLILLAGLSKLIKDFILFYRLGDPNYE